MRVLSSVMIMKTLLFFTIFLIKGHMGDAADAVTGITGGSVIINFQYKNKISKESTKSFCRVSDDKCTEAQSTLWIPEERFSMTDDKSINLISVLIRNLTVNDSGAYRCKGIKEVKLDVKRESCCGTSEEQTAYLRGTALIHCKYPDKYQNDPKQLFKVQNGSLQSYFTLGGAIDPRFSLNVKEQEHVFTVTIAHVNRHDDGVYFCGAHVQNNHTKIRYSPLFTEIQLHVSEQADASIQSDLHIIITVCVCLILLLSGGLSLLLLKRRCKKTEGSVSSDQRSTRDGNEVVSSAYYETIPDSGNTTFHPSAQKPIRLNTVYDTAHLPTNPSDSDFYTLG